MRVGLAGRAQPASARRRARARCCRRAPHLASACCRASATCMPRAVGRPWVRLPLCSASAAQCGVWEHALQAARRRAPGAGQEREETCLMACRLLGEARCMGLSHVSNAAPACACAIIRAAHGVQALAALQPGVMLPLSEGYCAAAQCAADARAARGGGRAAARRGRAPGRRAARARHPQGRAAGAWRGPAIRTPPSGKGPWRRLCLHGQELACRSWAGGACAACYGLQRELFIPPFPTPCRRRQVHHGVHTSCSQEPSAEALSWAPSSAGGGGGARRAGRRQRGIGPRQGRRGGRAAAACGLARAAGRVGAHAARPSATSRPASCSFTRRPATPTLRVR